jgi:hypothetical protein
MEPKLTIGPVARELDLSVARVRQLDAELQPERGDLGVRLYDRARVDAVAARRRTAADQRDRQRLGRLLAGRPTPGRRAAREDAP